MKRLKGKFALVTDIDAKEGAAERRESHCRRAEYQILPS